MWILALILSVAQSTYPSWVYEATATFHRYAMGEVSVVNGHVMIDLDITNISMYQGVSGTVVPENCFDNGAYVFIHEEWNNAEDEYDYMGRNNCDNDQTGDHFDPWFACSIGSSQNDCNYNGGCIRPSSFISYEAGVQYRCNDSIYSEYPYACEIGDMKKHETMLSTSGNKIKETYASLWELNGLDFGEDFSIVFHCSNVEKTPVLCAKFNTTNRTMSRSDPKHKSDSNKKISVNFNGLKAYDKTYNGIAIEQGQGWIRYKLPSVMSHNCTMWSAYIMNDWNTTMMDNKNKPRYDQWCNWSYVGGVYDPTYSCINQDDGGMESGNMHCTDGNRCPDDGNTAVDYECDNWENALKCAAGHMTGKTGYIMMEKGKSYDMTFYDRTSPPLQDLVGRSILLKCESENAMPMKICAPITSSSLSMTTAAEEVGFTAGGAIAIVLLILLGIGIGSAYWYGKKHPKQQNNNNNKFAALPGTTPNTSIASINNAPRQDKPLATGAVVDNGNEIENKPIYAPPPETNDIGNENEEIILAPVSVEQNNDKGHGYTETVVVNDNKEYNNDDEEYEHYYEEDVNNQQD